MKEVGQLVSALYCAISANELQAVKQGRRTILAADFESWLDLMPTIGAEEDARKLSNPVGERLRSVATEIATELPGKRRDENGQGTIKNGRSPDEMGLSVKEQNKEGSGPENFKTGALNRSATFHVC